MTEKRDRAYEKWLLFIVFLAAFLLLDWGASTKLNWQAAWALWKGTEGTAPAGAATASEATALVHGMGSTNISVLIGMALSMYALAAYTTMRSVLAVRATPEPLGQDVVQVIQKVLREVLRAEGPTKEADPTRMLLDDHRRLRERVAKLENAKAQQVLGRISPRELLGVDQLEQALSASVVARWRDALTGADAVDALGQFVATAGIASTVAGLIVAGLDLGETTKTGLALSAALLKCFIGFGARLICIAAHDHIYRAARQDEDALLNGADSQSILGGGA